MGVAKFLVLSLLAHAVLIGGLWGVDKFYLQPAREADEKALTEKKEKAKAETDRRKKMTDAGTARIVTPQEDKPAAETDGKGADPTRPSGKPEDYKGFKKADKKPPALPGEDMDLDLK